jgi:DNA-binding response OmpR family regulator
VWSLSHPVEDESGPDLGEEEGGLLGHPLSDGGEVPNVLEAGVVEDDGEVVLLVCHLLHDGIGLSVVCDGGFALIGLVDAVDDKLLCDVSVKVPHGVLLTSVVCKEALSGFEVETEQDGTKGLARALTEDYDLILLDLMLPGIDGYEVCREIRKTSNIPIIMLSAKGEIFDKVLGLELGADDYMIKPFDSKELVARVKAVLRRLQPAKTTIAPNPSLKCVEYPNLTVNLSNYSVICDGKQVDMPPKELELLYFLASSPNQVFTREQLLDHIWGYEYIGDTRTVDVHVKRLREKIKDHASWQIGTVWGIGYKFEVK